MSKTVIFDFDGTIADSERLLVDIYSALAPKLKTPILTPELIQELKSKSAAQILKTFQPKWKIPLLAFLVNRRLSQRISELKPFAGIPEILKELKKDYQIGILSSNRVKNINNFLKLSELELFDFVIGERRLLGKAERLKKLLKQKKLDRENTIYVGDELKDIEACQKIQLPIISVTWGLNSREKILEANPQNYADTPQELLKKIRQNL